MRIEANPDFTVFEFANEGKHGSQNPSGFGPSASPGFSIWLSATKILQPEALTTWSFKKQRYRGGYNNGSCCCHCLYRQKPGAVIYTIRSAPFRTRLYRIGIAFNHPTVDKAVVSSLLLVKNRAPRILAKFVLCIFPFPLLQILLDNHRKTLDTGTFKPFLEAISLTY